MYDLIVIGAGPGGYTAAIRASQLGAEVAIIEKGELGGVCLNRGCIPTKALIACAEALREAKSLGEFGVAAGEIRFDMNAAQERKSKIVSKLRAGIESLVKGNKIELVRGDAKFTGPGKLSVGGNAIEGKNVLIAAGSTWSALPGVEPDGKLVVTSDEALSFDEVPDRLCIIGGGVIGCEFACMMSTFGSRVSVVEAMPSILPRIEPIVSRILARQMKQDGIGIATSTTVERVDKSGSACRLSLSNGEEIAADRIMVSIGRVPNTASLQPAAAGIELDKRGAIVVDSGYETSCKGTYAIGDCIGGAMLAHVASHQGIAVAERLFGGKKGARHGAIPSPIFTRPEIGSVGATSEELKASGKSFKTGRFPYAANGRALASGRSDGQAIVHADESGRVLGAHIIGHNATELVAEAALAIDNGLTVGDIAATIHSHPTLSEVFSEAAMDTEEKAIHKLR